MHNSVWEADPWDQSFYDQSMEQKAPDRRTIFKEANWEGQTQYCASCGEQIYEGEELWGEKFTDSAGLEIAIDWWHPDCWTMFAPEWHADMSVVESIDEEETARITELKKQLEIETEKLARKLTYVKLVNGLVALSHIRELTELQSMWHVYNTQLRAIVGPDLPVAVIRPEDEERAQYLLTDWRQRYNTPTNPYPNINTVGGPITGMMRHSKAWDNERIQMLSGEYRGQLGSTMGLDSTGELMLELDDGVQLFSSEAWWVHRHDHCDATCPQCGEFFTFINAPYSAEAAEMYEMRTSVGRLMRELMELV